MAAHRKKLIFLSAVSVIFCMILIIPAALFIMSYTREARSPGIPVLMYHGVIKNDKPAERYSIPEETLASHLEFLRNQGYTAITDHDLLAISEGRIKMPDKPVVITFDDGTRDHAAIARPLLKADNLKAVFFVITGRIDHPGSLTNDDITGLLRDGMSVQSHSTSGRRLTTLAEEERARALSESRAMLANNGSDVISFCLPGGGFNSKILKEIRDAGYLLVFSSEPGTTFPGPDTFLFRRIEVRGTMSSEDLAHALTPFDLARKDTVWKLKRFAKLIIGRR